METSISIWMIIRPWTDSYWCGEINAYSIVEHEFLKSAFVFTYRFTILYKESHIYTKNASYMEILKGYVHK